MGALLSNERRSSPGGDSANRHWALPTCRSSGSNRRPRSPTCIDRRRSRCGPSASECRGCFQPGRRRGRARCARRHRRRPMVVWDPPITRLGIGLRTPAVNQVALWVSRLGRRRSSWSVGSPAHGAARRCRSVAVVMLILSRPTPVSMARQGARRASAPLRSSARARRWLRLSQRPRVGSRGAWGFVPVIAALYLRRRSVWWALTTLAVAVIGLVAWCRVWLGVHWTSDSSIEH